MYTMIDVLVLVLCTLGTAYTPFGRPLSVPMLLKCIHSPVMHFVPLQRNDLRFVVAFFHELLLLNCKNERFLLFIHNGIFPREFFLKGIMNVLCTGRLWKLFLLYKHYASIFLYQSRLEALFLSLGILQAFWGPSVIGFCLPTAIKLNFWIDFFKIYASVCHVIGHIIVVQNS